ncbi:hypothetical protein L3X38_037110 [Prunus dulcis]|uniref:Retrotransposon gag domain-containing protein n=1 Tax=Prunus dulcis TaxID=3755 RepID=A0AAD4V321_PRUDU|nr:hypothetical protein L3X38_037110 [Prunus dulcis]
MGVQQLDGESFHEYWDRFQRLLASCPHHQIEDWLLMQYFYEGLLDSERMMVDATSGGGLTNKSATQAKEMFENIAANSQQFNYRRAPSKKAGVYEVSASDIGPQIANLTNLVKQLIPQAQVCAVCANPGHPTESCPSLYGNGEEMAQAHYMQHKSQETIHFLTLIIRDGGNTLTLDGRTTKMCKQPQFNKMSLFLNKMHLHHLGKETRQTQAQMSTAIKSLENQVGQIAASLSQREPGKFPSQVIPNPNGGHDTANVITLRSGKKVEKDDNEERNSTKTVAAPSPKLTVPSDNSKVSSLVNHSITSKVPFPRELKRTSVSIQLVDRSIKYPKGVLEDVLVKVNELIFPADFLVLEMEEAPIPGKDLPLILGRPFMRTARTKIDVYEGTLTMAFDEETVEFKVFDALKYPNDDHACFSMDVLERMVQETFNASQKETPLETALIQSPETVNEEGNTAVLEAVNMLEALPPQRGQSDATNMFRLVILMIWTRFGGLRWPTLCFRTI